MSVRRDVYPVRVSIDGNSVAVKNPTVLTDTSVASYYSTGFSPGVGWGLLSYARVWVGHGAERDGTDARISDRLSLQ